MKSKKKLIIKTAAVALAVILLGVGSYGGYLVYRFNCDKILVFDNAELIETETHNELVSANGKYATLWNAQASFYLE